MIIKFEIIIELLEDFSKERLYFTIMSNQSFHVLKEYIWCIGWARNIERSKEQREIKSKGKF
ncbi:hypothetical protein SDC9_162884 [bioreactor metagenome]|uniref:Uncharacterized protein n=1 Tax=bioreactor metagenome TaxID=1076179 RepID=A0A645FNN1_9ZZZZ